jgi:hypothetical protein
MMIIILIELNTYKQPVRNLSRNIFQKLTENEETKETREASKVAGSITERLPYRSLRYPHRIAVDTMPRFTGVHWFLELVGR